MKATLIFSDWLDAIEDLTTEERGELLTLILLHINGEDAQPVSPAVRGAWGFVKRAINIGSELSEKRRVAGSKGGKVKQSEANESKVKQSEANESNSPNINININTKHKQHPNGCVLNAPAREEVIDFFVKENSTAEIGAAFFDYCEAENWTRKSGQPLLAWQSAARIWMREEFRRQNQPKEQKYGKSGNKIASAEDFDNDI